VRAAICLLLGLVHALSDLVQLVQRSHILSSAPLGLAPWTNVIKVAPLLKLDRYAAFQKPGCRKFHQPGSAFAVTLDAIEMKMRQSGLAIMGAGRDEEVEVWIACSQQCLQLAENPWALSSCSRQFLIDRYSSLKG